MLAGFFIGGYATLLYTTVLTFINPVLMAKGIITSHELMISQTLLILIAISSLIVFGKMADKFSPSKIMQWSSGLLIILAYPLLFLISHRQLAFLSMAIFIAINEMLLGPANAYLKNIFATEYRYRAISFSFCLGMSIIGGLTPVVENFLYHLTGHFQLVAIWLIFISLGTFLTLNQIHKKQTALLLEPRELIA